VPIFGTTDIRYLRSDTADNAIRYRNIDPGFVDLVISRRTEVGRYRAQTLVSRVHCSPAQTEFTSTVTRMHTGQLVVRLANNAERQLSQGRSFEAA